jgi:hypothetical protein
MHTERGTTHYRTEHVGRPVFLVSNMTPLRDRLYFLDFEVLFW